MDYGGTPARQAEKAMVDSVLRRWQAAQSERAAWLSTWQSLADYVRPSRQVFARSDAPTLTGFENLFDGTAISANMTLASGCMARLTPAQTPWFKFDAPRGINSDAVDRWYAECTDIALEALATSNFYTELHELYLDRGGFGSACLHSESTTKHPLNFRAYDMGSFALLNGADGLVDTVFVEREYTAREAAQVYAEHELPECILKELRENVHSGRKHKFLHVVYPREDAERDGGKVDGANKPVASVHIYLPERCLVRNSGFDEMPTFGTRYLRWGTGSYGIGPAWQALPEARQLNELQKHMDVLAEVAAFPRFLVPYDQEGEVDLRASGHTFFKDPNHIPREWMTGGRYDIGLDRVKQRQEAIKTAFHVELFQMWAAISKQMTAHEVNAREQEKIELFSPTFTLLTTELYGPILRRVFSLLLRQSVFPQPPEEAVYQDARGRWNVPNPKIRYMSRLALALQAIHGSALTRTLGTFAPFVEARPDLLDNINFDRAFRDIGRDEGIPAEWMPPEDEVAQLRAARAQAQAQQILHEQQMNEADAAGKLARSGLMEPRS
jgi:hypothetical protein